MFDVSKIRDYHCPRWEELPSVPLYMDQVVMVVGDALDFFSWEDEPAITSAMVNNYVKQKFISPPEKKKYSRNQIGRLIVLSLFKRVFSMLEITRVISRMEDSYGVSRAYDIFCETLEEYTVGAFSEEDFVISISPSKEPAQSMLETALSALMCKLVVQNDIRTEAAE